MIKICLFVFIFTLASSKIIPSVKLGVNTTFDKNNNEFTFQYSGPGKDIILFYFNCLDYDIECPNGSIEASSSNEFRIF